MYEWIVLHKDTRLLLWFLFILTTVLGCQKETSKATPEADAGDTDSDTGEQQIPMCDDGLPAWEWEERDEGVAPDFDLPASDMVFTDVEKGEISLKETWTGCDTYIFIIDYDGSAWADQAFASPLDELITDAPDNLRYVIMSTNGSEEDRVSRVEEIGADLKEIVAANFDGEQAQSWLDRIYLARENPYHVDGIKELFDRYSGEFPYTIASIAIDRSQRLREISSVSDYNSSGFFPRMSFARYSAPYFNWLYALETRINSEDASGDVLKVKLFEGDVVWSSGWYKEYFGHSVYFPLDLPQPEDLAAFNHLEVDVSAACSGRRVTGERHPVYWECEPWDAVAALYLCEGGDGDTCDTPLELVRWITPYRSEGRWVVDISHVLPSLNGGGRQWIGLNGPDYLFDVDFRFSTVTEEDTPTEHFSAVKVYEADEKNKEVEFQLPEDFSKVVVTVVPSGHGNAEFSTWTTNVDVNGTEYSNDFLMENSYRCAERTNEGVVPNQAGTWFFDRSSWCPGWPVERWIFEITEAVHPGDNQLAYTVDVSSGDVHSEVIVTVWK